VPDSDWRERYAGWPALKKLRQVDQVLRELAPTKQLVRSRDRPGSLPSLRLTLREHYRHKQAHLVRPHPLELDHELRRLFDEPQEGRRREPAATFLRRERHALRTRVSALTGQYRYVVDQTLDAMQQRCAALDLRLAQPRNQARLGAAVLATRATMQMTNGHRPRFRR
jgi:hypothetical protein